MTNDQNAPERMYWHPNFMGCVAFSNQPITDSTEYIRHDIYEQVVKERNEYRSILVRAINALGGGATDDVSDDFLSLFIDECAIHRRKRDALQRQLAQCRREALEEAAKLCERNTSPPFTTCHECWNKACAASAADIRELIEKEGGG